MLRDTPQRAAGVFSKGMALLAGNGTEACVKATVPESQQHRFSTPFSQGTQIFHVFRPWLGFDDPDNVLFARCLKSPAGLCLGCKSEQQSCPACPLDQVV